MRRVALVLLLVAARAAAQETPAPAELVPPELVTAAPAEYPPEARAAGKEAVVPLEILVDADGHSAEVRVVTPVGDGFDEAAVAAAKAFVWKPGRVGGAPVSVRLRYDLRFDLPKPPPPPPPAGVLAGTIRERGTRAPVPFAEISLTPGGAAAVADERGAFRVEGLAAGSYRVTVVATGHVRATFDETLKEHETLAVRYGLERTSANPYRTIVEGGPPREEVERHSASGAQAQRVPGTRGDALRVIETFPGVARPPFGIGALIVRGSNPEATTSYIAGHELPILYHFGGVTSIVNSDLIERIDFLPGNFSARYGRATGGVVFADLRAPRRDRWGGQVTVSPLDTSALVEGPVGAGSLAVAGRRSYVDVVLNAIIPDDADVGLTLAPVYWDYQAIWDTPALGGRFTLTALGSDDKLELLLKKPGAVDPAVRGTIAQTTYIQRLIASWRKSFGRTAVSASLAQGVTAFTASIGQALSVEVKQWFQSYRVEVAHAAAGWLKLTFGVDGQIYPFSVHAKGPRPPQEGDVPSPTSTEEQLVQDIDGWEIRAGGYAEAAFRIGPVTITPGLRFDAYKLISEVSLDPRLTAVWEVGDDRLHAGLGRYSRMVQEYQSDPVYGNPDLTPEHAIHASVGYDRLLGPVRLESSVFGKWLTDQAVRSDTLVTKADGSRGPVGYASIGTGRVYGLELLVRAERLGPLTGWVSYTLSRAERRDAPGEPFRLFSFDQTHILTVVAATQLPWKLLFGARVRYVTGNPVTPVTGSIYDADSDAYTPIAGATNSERIAAAHGLDLRLERPWLFESWKLTAFIDLTNVYNHRSAEGLAFSYDYREREVIAGLPLLPSLGVKGEF